MMLRLSKSSLIISGLLGLFTLVEAALMRHLFANVFDSFFAYSAVTISIQLQFFSCLSLLGFGILLRTVKHFAFALAILSLQTLGIFLFGLGVLATHVFNWPISFITPYGGSIMMLAWLLFIVALIKLPVK